MRLEFKISKCLNGILSYTILILKTTLSNYRVKKIFPIHQIFSIYMQKTNWTRKWISRFFFRKRKLLGIENKSTSAIKLKKKSNYWKNWNIGWHLTHFQHKNIVFVKLSLSIVYMNVFYILYVTIDCFMRTKIPFQL